MAQLISYSGEPESKWKEESILQSFRSGDDKENITISKLAFEEIQLAKRHREIIDHSALVSSLSLAPGVIMWRGRIQNIYWILGNFYPVKRALENVQHVRADSTSSWETYR